MPPAPAFQEKAPWKMLAKAAGRFSRNTQSTPRDAPKNSRVMAGTRPWAIFAPTVRPPRATTNTNTPRHTAATQGATPRLFRAAAAAWVWAIFPMPREAIQQPPAYRAAKGFPHLPARRMYPNAPGAPGVRYRAARAFSA